MSAFPLFVDLERKKCIVVGGGEVASRKVEILLRFHAQLYIIAPEVSSSIEELGQQGKISISKKCFSPQDMEGAFLAIAATSSAEVNESVFREAQKRNIPVNVVDDPGKCTFLFPSVIQRGDLTIGISTAGTYPALTKKIRKIAEEVFTEEYSEILCLLGDFRAKVRKSPLHQRQRGKLLAQVVDEFYDEGIITHTALARILKKYEEELQEEAVFIHE